MRFFVILPVLFATLPGMAPGQDAEALTLLNQAIENHNSGRIEEAVKDYEAFLSRYPDRAAVRSNLGAAYVRLGRFGDAIEQYKQALASGGSNTDIRFNLALAYYKAGAVDLAREELEQVVTAQPANKNAVLILADCYLQGGKAKRVIELLTPIAPANPDDLALAYLLGTALIREKQTEKGQILIDRILKNGDSAEAHLMLGTSYLLVHDFPGAVKEFEQAVKLNPKLPGLNAIYGNALGEMGQTEPAMNAYKRELEINPYNFDSNLFLGVDYYKREQNYAEALACFERALRVRPDADEVRFQMSVVYVAQGRTEEALKLLHEIVGRAPDFLEAHVSLATIYYRMRRREEADRHRAIVERLRSERQAKARVTGANPTAQPPVGEQPGGPK